MHPNLKLYEIDPLTQFFLKFQSPVEAAVFLAAEGKISPDDVQRVKRSAVESDSATADANPDWFRSMDANGNGFLEPEEIDK